MPHSPIITQVAIISDNRVLANTKLETKNHLLWKFESDMKRFQAITKRHPVIMGRTTYETIGKPLPNRTNIVVTRNADYKAFGCVVAHSIQEAVEWAKMNEKEEIFIIGGGQIYAEALPFTDRLYLTVVEGDFEGDIMFPEYQNEFNKVLFQENQLENGQKFKFINLSR